MYWKWKSRTRLPSWAHDQLNVSGIAALAGELNVTPFGGYTDPVAAGSFDEFTLILAGLVSGMFDDFVYDGSTLALTFSGGGMDRYHEGDGLFRIVDYDAAQVDLLNYQALPGDANGDGNVDGTDFGIWNANKFAVGTDWTTGDFNGDGRTDGSDFGIWNTNKFTSVPLGSPSGGSLSLAEVPEPATGLLVLATALAGLQVRRRTDLTAGRGVPPSGLRRRSSNGSPKRQRERISYR